jgi:hypothetical protein
MGQSNLQIFIQTDKFKKVTVNRWEKLLTFRFNYLFIFDVHNNIVRNFRVHNVNDLIVSELYGLGRMWKEAIMP